MLSTLLRPSTAEPEVGTQQQLPLAVAIRVHSIRENTESRRGLAETREQRREFNTLTNSFRL